MLIPPEETEFINKLTKVLKVSCGFKEVVCSELLWQMFILILN